MLTSLAEGASHFVIRFINMCFTLSVYSSSIYALIYSNLDHSSEEPKNIL